jgi:nucleotide-binding universal stress UspA family protein
LPDDHDPIEEHTMSDPSAAGSSGSAPGAGAVLVGVDASDGSRDALDHALDEAHWRNAPLVAVTAFEPPDLWVTSRGLVPSATQLQHAAREQAETMIDTVVEARKARGVPVPAVHLLVREGPAAVVLETLSAEAALLVVGHRGRGALASRMIGSTGLSVVLHAACTVTVVRRSGPSSS